MHRPYYIETEKGRDGPHDLIDVMRRIRTGRITGDTLIYVDGDASFRRAADIPEIALFFDRSESAPAPGAERAPTIRRLLTSGWQFILNNNAMTVYAGGLLLVTFILTLSFVVMFGAAAGAALGWCAFVVLHHLYMLFVLRMYRRQPVGDDFYQRQLSPVLPTLMLSSAVLAIMMAGGWLLGIVPGMAVAVIYIFVPFLILDRRYSMIEAMHASRLLLGKHGTRTLALGACLALMHLFCILLVFPIPVSLPLFSAALAELYEELSLA